jgi:transcriptional regulator with XRE-family HTH domain
MERKKFNRLKVVLAEKEMTNRDLAKTLGVRDMTVSRWATNSQQPTLDTLFKIAEVLQISVCDLLEKPERYTVGGSAPAPMGGEPSE